LGVIRNELEEYEMECSAIYILAGTWAETYLELRLQVTVNVQVIESIGIADIAKSTTGGGPEYGHCRTAVCQLGFGDLHHLGDSPLL
jgi:hypothetical protein